MNIDKEFAQLIQENKALIHKVAAFYAYSEDDRNDLFQEIFVQLWKAFATFRNEAKASTWLYRVALNTAVTGLRKRKRYIKWTAIDQRALNYAEDKDPEQEDRIKYLYRCIEKLNELDKGIVLLFLEDKSHQEIADITGLSKTNIGTRLSRIRHKIRTQIVNA